MMQMDKDYCTIEVAENGYLIECGQYGNFRPDKFVALDQKAVEQLITEWFDGLESAGNSILVDKKPTTYIDSGHHR